MLSVFKYNSGGEKKWCNLPSNVTRPQRGQQNSNRPVCYCSTEAYTSSGDILSQLRNVRDDNSSTNKVITTLAERWLVTTHRRRHWGNYQEVCIVTCEIINIVRGSRHNAHISVALRIYHCRGGTEIQDGSTGSHFSCSHPCCEISTRGVTCFLRSLPL